MNTVAKKSINRGTLVAVAISLALMLSLLMSLAKPVKVHAVAVPIMSGVRLGGGMDEDTARTLVSIICPWCS